MIQLYQDVYLLWDTLIPIYTLQQENYYFSLPKKLYGIHWNLLQVYSVDNIELDFGPNAIKVPKSATIASTVSYTPFIMLIEFLFLSRGKQITQHCQNCKNLPIWQFYQQSLLIETNMNYFGDVSKYLQQNHSTEKSM